MLSPTKPPRQVAGKRTVPVPEGPGATGRRVLQAGWVWLGWGWQSPSPLWPQEHPTNDPTQPHAARERLVHGRPPSHRHSTGSLLAPPGPTPGQREGAAGPPAGVLGRGSHSTGASSAGEGRGGSPVQEAGGFRDWEARGNSSSPAQPPPGQSLAGGRAGLKPWNMTRKGRHSHPACQGGPEGGLLQWPPPEGCMALGERARICLGLFVRVS